MDCLQLLKSSTSLMLELVTISNLFIAEDRTLTENEPKYEVLILTDTYRIQGFIAHFKDMRLTDYMVEAKAFIAVSNAQIKDLNGKPINKSKFLNVSANKIQVIIPVSDIISES